MTLNGFNAEILCVQEVGALGTEGRTTLPPAFSHASRPPLMAAAFL